MFLLFFISISGLAYTIPSFLDLIEPFQIDLIDYSSQIIISLPFFVHDVHKIIDEMINEKI